MIRSITKDTQLCMSLAARPGNFDTRCPDHLIAVLNLDYVYKAFTISDLPAAVSGIRALGIRGCAVLVPFKKACIALVDELNFSAVAIASVNTIVNTCGRLDCLKTLVVSHAL